MNGLDRRRPSIQPVVEFGQCLMLRRSTTTQLWCAVCHSIHACAVLDLFAKSISRYTRVYLLRTLTKKKDTSTFVVLPCTMVVRSTKHTYKQINKARCIFTHFQTCEDELPNLKFTVHWPAMASKAKPMHA